MSDISISLTYENARDAIDWLCRAFGFEAKLVVPGHADDPTSVAHSELAFGDSVIMVSSAKAERGRISPASRGDGVTAAMSVHVADPDAHHDHALAAGATVVQALRDEEHGARGYMCRDVGGHLWYFSDYRPGAYWKA